MAEQPGLFEGSCELFYSTANKSQPVFEQCREVQGHKNRAVAPKRRRLQPLEDQEG